MNQQQQTTVKVNSRREIPDDFTGIVEFSNKTIVFLKNGKCHRTDGPAIETLEGYKKWFIDDKTYGGSKTLENLLDNSIFLSADKNGPYNLCWLKFLTEDKGIEEFPIVLNYPFSLKCLAFLSTIF